MVSVTVRKQCCCQRLLLLQFTLFFLLFFFFGGVGVRSVRWIPFHHFHRLHRKLLWGQQRWLRHNHLPCHSHLYRWNQPGLLSLPCWQGCSHMYCRYVTLTCFIVLFSCSRAMLMRLLGPSVTIPSARLHSHVLQVCDLDLCWSFPTLCPCKLQDVKQLCPCSYKMLSSCVLVATGCWEVVSLQPLHVDQLCPCSYRMLNNVWSVHHPVFL